MRVILDVDEHQAYILKNILENVSRLGMRQFDSLGWMLELLGLHSDNIEQTENILKQLKISFSPELSVGACYGITSDKVPEDFKTLWDMYQVLRHELAWDRKPEGNLSNVEFDEPYQISSNELIIVKIQK
jgi:hypothetical protein